MFDPRVKDWPLIGSPVYLLVIIALYLFFVLVAGPKFMENRRPYNLKKIIAAYNILQVLANAYLFYGNKLYHSPSKLQLTRSDSSTINTRCSPLQYPHSTEPEFEARCWPCWPCCYLHTSEQTDTRTTSMSASCARAARRILKLLWTIFVLVTDARGLSRLFW
uniref:Elongation of very long chain fatty acids protein n=1 Tax=Timema douglasi TaxID=61478 RepID=A0A7R8Z7U1_TIMDO|nr:unnamed protein product [Timema douglasi]